MVRYEHCYLLALSSVYEYYTPLLTNLLSMHIGRENCSINVHLLLHLPKQFGPLWAHSTFGFESHMHSLLNYCHSTCGIEKQVRKLSLQYKSFIGFSYNMANCTRVLLIDIP